MKKRLLGVFPADVCLNDNALPETQETIIYKEIITMETRTTKCILNPSMARKLLKAGNPIVDIKANKVNKTKTVFIFEVTDKFTSDFTKISEENKKADKSGTIGAFDPSFFEGTDGNMSEL